MKRAAICILAASAALSTWAQGPNGTPDVVGKLKNVEGLVTVSEGNQLVNAFNNAPLVKDSRIITTSSGSVELVFDNGCDIILKPNQSLVVDDGHNCAALLASVRPVGAPVPGAPVYAAGGVPPLLLAVGAVGLVYVIGNHNGNKLSGS